MNEKPDLLSFARRLHGWGANVTAIQKGTKRPGHKWRQWQARRQTEAELNALPWARPRRGSAIIASLSRRPGWPSW